MVLWLLTRRPDGLYLRQVWGTTAPRESAMVDLTSPLERDPVIEAYKEHVDRTLLRENLRRTVRERFERLIELQRLADEVRRAGRV